MTQMKMTPLFHMRAEIAAPQLADSGPYGDRRYMPVTGGEFEGDRLRGVMLPGGADCQLIRPDGVAELDVRAMMETDDGVQFLMKGIGLRHASAEAMERIKNNQPVEPGSVYFCETFFFEAPQGKYEWLNRLVGVGTGERKPDGVHIDVFELS